MVSPSEGNEVRRDGRQGVGVPHSSAEAGERPFRTLWSEGGAALWMGSWNHAEDAVPQQRVTARQPDRVRDSDLQRDEPDTSTRKSGSVGARGGKLPRATRPDLAMLHRDSWSTGYAGTGNRQSKLTILGVGCTKALRVGLCEQASQEVTGLLEQL